MEFSQIKANIADVKARLAVAAEKSPSGKAPQLLFATKYATAEQINFAAAEEGHILIGENRVQQLLSKYDALDRDKIEIHFIGSLQTNKVKYIIDKVTMIHSVDSVELAREIDKRAEKAGIIMDVLVEVNSGNEESKGGIEPDDVERFADEIAGFSHIRVRGLMTMAPKCENKSDYIKYFKETYRIFIDFCRKKLHNIYDPVLSMGMSDSFEQAAGEGATIVRVGGAIFGK